MSDIRDTVRRMNELLERGDIRGYKELVEENGKEAMVAANYVNAKYRYLTHGLKVPR